MLVELSNFIEESPARVWQALTNPEEMRQWYFESIKDFRAEVGFHTTLTMGGPERKFTAHWEVTEVIPQKCIGYDWTYEEYPGKGAVRFTLQESGTGTLLSVKNLGLESFPQHIPEFTKESCEAGWHYFLKERLPSYFNQKAKG